MKAKNKIGKIYCEIIMKVKLSLWSAIKLRIAGMKNLADGLDPDIEIDTSKYKIHESGHVIPKNQKEKEAE